jgi:hypothetical protein
LLALKKNPVTPKSRLPDVYILSYDLRKQTPIVSPW